MGFVSEIYLDERNYARYDSLIPVSQIALAVAEKVTGIREVDLVQQCFSKSTPEHVSDLEKSRLLLLEAISKVDASDYLIIPGCAASLKEALKRAGISPNSRGLEIVSFQTNTEYSVGEDDKVYSTLIVKKLKWLESRQPLHRSQGKEE